MALIRCEKCGNPVSSKSKACPVCGTPLAGESPAVEASVVEASVEKAPKTLNDIIAERSTQRTLNDTHTTVEEKPAERVVIAEPQSVQMPEPEVRAGVDSAYVEDLEVEIERSERSIKGLKTMLLIVAMLLLPAAYFSISYIVKYRSIKEDYAIVESARQLFEEQNTLLQKDAESLVSELEALKDRNDTMMLKYQEAVTMLEQLQKERTYNYNQLAKYKKEVESLRGVMKGYLRQIDSLNTINSNLQAENVAYKKEITTAQLRADVAEERADELGTKVRIGSVIRTSGVRIVALNDSSKEVRRIKQAARLRVDFELTANELAEPGEKSIYICITAPDGYVLSSEDMILFMYEGEEMMASAVRKVDYENQSVPVSIYYDGSHFEKGTYRVDIYIDGRHSGSQETYFE
ncbi:MAG: zinc-ribbon domain-containing protein [Alistipes sp.]|nr:zinc-ribbon domain-containing protein [Alistipes sp.]